MPAMILFTDGEVVYNVPDAEVAHLRPKPVYTAYQVAITIGRNKRKGKPYFGGPQERGEDGFYHSPPVSVLLAYKSDLDLSFGDHVLVEVGDHIHPREGVVMARESSYEGDLKEILGRVA